MNSKIIKKVQVWVFASPTIKPTTNHSAPHQVLCLLLKTNVERGDFWQPITGACDEGESIENAATRELQEETGFSTGLGTIVKTDYRFSFDSKFGQNEEFVFAALRFDAATPHLDQREHTDFRWVHPLDAVSMLKYDSNILGLKKAYAIVFGKEL